MRRPDGYTIAAIVLGLAAVGLAVMYAGTGPRATARTGSVHDDGPGGAAYVRRYFEAMGVRTRVVEGEEFSIDPDTKLLFILGRTETIADADLGRLSAWVNSGGRLVIASDLGAFELPTAQRLLGHFDVRTGAVLPAGRYPVGSIALAAPPVRAISSDTTGRHLATSDSQIPLVSDRVGSIATLAHLGTGTVIVVGTLSPFLDLNLGDDDNARFALALAWGAVASGGTVAFDEYHHGSHPSADLLVLITRTWPGRALIYGGLVVFLYLLLTGRRFGAPVILDPRPPRSSLEYVRSFAGLVRRARAGELARDRLRSDLRAMLTRSVGLDPATPFERVLATVGAADSARATEAAFLDQVLSRRLRDDELLLTVRRIDALTKEGEAHDTNG